MSIFQKIKSLHFLKKMLHLPKKMLLKRCLFPKLLVLVGAVFSLILSNPMKNFAQQMESTEDTTEKDTEEENTIVYKKDIYHQHLGGSSGGGCYSVQRTGSYTEEIPCGGSLVYWPDLGTSTCSRCAASYFGDEGGRGCWHSETKTTTYTYYDLGCGKGTNTYLGFLTVEQSTTDWVKSLVLTAGYESTGDMVVYEKPYIWNGADACADNIYQVNASGTYTLQLNADAYANTQAAVITVDVRNVDVTAPVIKAHSLEPASDWTKDGVMVTITETADLQPDGSEGCGLHDTPYSYDDGVTWTAESSYCYMENGTHSILVRDRLENVSSYEVSFQNIDYTPPTVESIEYDHTKNIPSTEIVITASDLQPDGSEGCGLHEMPYSFDGGETWTAEHTHTVHKNGTYQIVIRDALDNRITIEEKIKNIDCTGPRVSYTMVSDSWTNQDVRLYLAASDVNEDGTAGIGLADAWYSLDEGKNWSNQTTLVFEENTSFTITARDQNGNYSKTQINIIQIDKMQPWVSLSMDVIGEGMDMKVKLQAHAEDDYSGIAENAFSWDKGSTYSGQSSKVITENGLYQVYAKDKAGNSNNAVIEVDVFPALFPVIPIIQEEPETQMEIVESGTEEWESETATVTLEERIEEPEDIPVEVIEQKSTWEKLFFFLLLVLAGVCLIMLGLLLWSRTLAVYVKKANGKLQYVGRLWISHKEERYFVTIPESMVEKAMTMCFCFKPASLFVDSHKDEEMHFLFPEGVCITLTIERKMEME